MSAPTSAELEREAEQARANVNTTADQLRGKMTPGQVLDEVGAYFKGGDTGITFSNFQTQIRDNPMALGLVGAGLAWMMFGPSVRHNGASGHAVGSYPEQRMHHLHASDNDDDHAQSSGSGGGSMMSSMQHGASAVGSGIASGASSVGSGIASGAEAAASAVGSLASGAMSGMRSAADHTQSGLGQVGRDIGHMNHDLGRRSQAMAASARESASDLMHREPLIVGALGVALGAMIGAMLPKTEIEKQAMGDTAADMRDQAGSMVEKAWVKGSEAASHAITAAQDAARDEGLSADTIAGKVSRVAEAATSAVKHDIADAKADLDEAGQRRAE